MFPSRFCKFLGWKTSTIWNRSMIAKGWTFFQLKHNNISTGRKIWQFFDNLIDPSQNVDDRHLRLTIKIYSFKTIDNWISNCFINTEHLFSHDKCFFLYHSSIGLVHKDEFSQFSVRWIQSVSTRQKTTKYHICAVVKLVQRKSACSID